MAQFSHACMHGVYILQMFLITMYSQEYIRRGKSVVLRISPYKRALESAKVNVVGASRTYVIVWYLLPQTCTRVQPYSVPTCTPRSSLCVHAE